MKPSPRLSFATVVAILLLGVAGSADACTEREPTRSVGFGPHDFSTGANDTRLWREGDPGEPMFLRARVVDTCGKPVAGALVRILHANHDGVHEPGRWRAHLETDAAGTFKVVTVFPGYTGFFPRHVHFIIEHPGHQRLATIMFFKNDPTVDPTAEDLSMVLEEVKRGDRKGWVAGYEFVLAPN